MRIRKASEFVFRSYAQVFLSSRLLSGGLFFVGFVLVSPESALLSLIAVIIITLLMARNKENWPVMKTGLYGVNGALLGYSWVMFPEVSFFVKIVMTLCGAIILSLLLGPLTRRLHQRDPGSTFFSLPYVTAMWIFIAGIYAADISNPNFAHGWLALQRKEFKSAEAAFNAFKTQTEVADAYKHDGLGWTNYFTQNYPAAIYHFTQATKLRPEFADLYDGLGWSKFKMHDLSGSKLMFFEAIKLNPLIADSYDGLGWTAFYEGNLDESRSYFIHASLLAPFFADAYTGLQQICIRSGQRDAAERWGKIASFLKPMTGLHLVPISQIVCWILFMAGIFVHSRISFASAIVGITLGIASQQLLNQQHASSYDIDYFYNSVAVLIALSGHYLRPKLLTIGWLAGVFAALTIGWPFLSYISKATGFPILAAPFNLAMFGSIYLFEWIGRKNGEFYRTPLEIACTSPENAGLWSIRRQTADMCFNRIESTEVEAS